jgi:hypothetical protein
MLKIWLTWLQPGVGILGVLFILSSALAANAAPNTKTVNNTNKTNKQQSHQPASKLALPTDFAVEAALKSLAIPDTPDVAVRQLALDSMVSSGSKANVLKANSDRPTMVGGGSEQALANFVPNVGLPTVTATSATVAKKVEVKKTAQPIASAVVPGLFIGTTEVKVSSQFLPTSAPKLHKLFQPIAAKPAPKPQLVASAAVADPFPVVDPDRMASLNDKPANDNPAATAVASLVGGFVENNPLAAIPQGLQRILGNDSASQSAPAAVQQVGTPGSEMLALSNILDGGVSTPSVSRGATLTLDTAQAVASVPKFNLGIDTSASTKAAPVRTNKPVKAEAVLTAKAVNNDLSVAVKERKSDYVALLSDRQVNQKSQFDLAQPTWAISYRSENTNLGGLILGQPQSVAMMSNQPKLISSAALVTGKNTFPGF